jgi:hypothetical protein
LGIAAGHPRHASFGGRDRLAWTAVYQRCPETSAERDRTLRSAHDGFEQAFRGFDRDRYPVWRDWIGGAAEHPAVMRRPGGCCASARRNRRWPGLAVASAGR